MVDGMSYLQLFYNKACTRELEKDKDGNYIYKSNSYSTNAISPLYINLWCKNDGSHVAYRTSIKLVSSDLAVVISDEIPKIQPTEIVRIPVSITVPKGDKKKRNILLRFEYDSI